MLHIKPAALHRSNFLIIEPADIFSDVIQAVFDRKMPRIEPVNLGIGQIHQISFTTLGSEEDVILAPEIERLWPLFA